MPKKNLFGTDGVRGRANTGNMTPQKVLQIAQAAGICFKRGDHRHLVVIGKDTRLSGYMIEPALTAGFISVGMDVVLLGPLPTPAVSMLTTSLRADLGVMISASHNPYNDNGIKMFGPDGNKLSDKMEHEISQKVESFSESLLVSAEDLGKARRLDDAPGRYIEFAKATFEKDLRLDGLKIVIDCAHGAAYKIAPTVLWELGAEIIVIGASPNGRNINQECGATAPNALAQKVLEEKADVGISLDGDGDRLILCDEKGKILDGDQIIALLATWWQKWGLLKNPTVVSTIMANLGLENYLKQLGISLTRTPVGDRHVLTEMLKKNSTIGGEPSGHIILRPYSITGDGLVAALQVLAILRRAEKKASDLLAPFIPIEQLHKNLKLPCTLLSNEKVKAGINEITQILQKEGGRLIIRPSGTESCLRIMIEHADLTLANKMMGQSVELLNTHHLA